MRWRSLGESSMLLPMLRIDTEPTFTSAYPTTFASASACSRSFCSMRVMISSGSSSCVEAAIESREPSGRAGWLTDGGPVGVRKDDPEGSWVRFSLPIPSSVRRSFALVGLCAEPDAPGCSACGVDAPPPAPAPPRSPPPCAAGCASAPVPPAPPGEATAPVAEGGGAAPAASVPSPPPPSPFACSAVVPPPVAFPDASSASAAGGAAPPAAPLLPAPAPAPVPAAPPPPAAPPWSLGGRFVTGSAACPPPPCARPVVTPPPAPSASASGAAFRLRSPGDAPPPPPPPPPAPPARPLPSSFTPPSYLVCDPFGSVVFAVLPPHPIPHARTHPPPP
eukprot:Rhum_TRINITY_DN14467_c22_g1::Rhum_TRINITY_DN14467_c22_g1_i1::g.91831::m.91831